MSSRREALYSVTYDPAHPQFQPNPGLWYDRYLKEQAGNTLTAYVEHIRQTAKIREPQLYLGFFNRWKAELKKLNVEMREATVTGRLATGLGGANVTENGMTWHRTYGVPMIPGSSLKGTARAYAAANLAGEWQEGGKAFRTLFGGQLVLSGQKPEDKARVGIVIFYDALPVPGTFAIHNEVMTVHHPEYYQTGGQPPADWDSPTPIPFASVSGRFLIALGGDWVDTAFNILELALKHYGVGGKTSSGFGRFSFGGQEAVSKLEVSAMGARAIPDDYHRGTVRHWKTHRGYGHITPYSGGADIFIHHSDLPEGVTSLTVGRVVYYRVEETERGPKAVDVRLG